MNIVENFEEWFRGFKIERLKDVNINLYEKNRLSCAYAAGDKNGRKRTLEELLPKIEEAFFILKDIPIDEDWEWDENLTDAYSSIKESIKFINTELKKLEGE